MLLDQFYSPLAEQCWGSFQRVHSGQGENSMFKLFVFTAVSSNDYFQADIFTISSISCLSRDWDRVGKLLFYTITPPLMVLVLGIPVIVANILYVSHYKTKTAEFKNLKAKFYNAVSSCFGSRLFVFHGWD